jgi:hypothetical protein
LALPPVLLAAFLAIPASCGGRLTASAGGGAAGGGAAGDLSAMGSSAGEPVAGMGGAGAGASGLGGASGAPMTPIADRNRDVMDTALDVDLATQTATASITLAPSPSIGASLEIGDLDIRAVRLGQIALPRADQGTWLDVGVPASTDPIVLTIDYAWHFHAASDGVSSAGYTITWPYWCGDVFPCRSNPSDGTTFHLNVVGAPSGSIIYPAEIASPAPAYMAAWVVGNYTDFKLGSTTAGTRVVARYLSGGASATTMGTAYLRKAFDWMEQNIGPYRFGSEVGPVAAPWKSGAFGGLEHHPFWHIAVASFADPSVHVHEAAHGWFGNGVRLRCWEDFVLSEGTVSYLAARVLEEVAGTSVSQGVWNAYLREELQNQLADAGARWKVAWPRSCGQIDILADGYYTRAPYVMGALFYRAIEQKIGRAAFDVALRTFYQRWAGKAAGMQDMLDVITEVSGYDTGPCVAGYLENATGQAPTGCR